MPSYSQMLLYRIRKLEKRNVKQYFLSNPFSDYMLICSSGGVASSALYQILNTYSPLLINPVVDCSLKDRLSDAKLKHLIRPLTPSNLSTFPSLFQNDLARSNVDVSKIKKAIYVVGDPALTAMSLYKRGLAKDFVQDISQKEDVSLPPSLEALAAHSEDPFRLEEQLDNWLQGSDHYDVMVVKYPDFLDQLEPIARFAGVSPSILKKDLKRRRRRNKKDQVYDLLSSKIYSGLQRKIEQLPSLQIIERNVR